MNSLERVAAAVKLRETDRVPVIAQVFGHAARLAGVNLNNYVRDGRILADCQLKALRHYGYDAVFSVMDVSVETEALGSVLRYDSYLYPVVEKYALSTESDWRNLSVPDPQRAGRMPQMLKALNILQKEVGRETLVVGCVLGPFTLVTQLLGMEKTLYLGADEPNRLESLLDFAAEVVIRFGLAQCEAGAHVPIVFDPSASPAVIPPAFFREFELPRLKKLFQALSDAGAIANWLHIAGPVNPILKYYPEAGVNIANLDYNVNIVEARELTGICFDGNIKSLTFVEGNPADITAQASTLIGTFRERGGFILSSGCEIPPESKPENVASLVKAAQG